MRTYIEKFKKNRLLTILASITVIFIIFGVLFLAMQSREVKEIINNIITELLEKLKIHDFSCKHLFITAISTNLVINLLIWILGISLIGLPVVAIIYAIKCIMLGFTIASFIYFYKVKGVIIGVIYIIPNIIGLALCFVMSYYSLRFSITLFNYLFLNRDNNKRIFVSRYLKLLGMIIILIIFNALIEGFIIPNILNFLLSNI